MQVEREQVLAFRLARSGLAVRSARSPAEAAACPASDFARHAALLALSARTDALTREAYDAALDAGELVVAHAIRGAIHALAPVDRALFGAALVAEDDRELGAQLGRQVEMLSAEHGIAPTAALQEVADATCDALAAEGPLDRVALHQAYRGRVRGELMPWCRGCATHHVAPMLWRYATVAAGARLDSRRRYVAGRRAASGPAAQVRPDAAEAVRRFLRASGPATAGDFAEWAGVATSHAQRLWAAVEGELAEVRCGRARAWLLAADLDDLASPPAADGVRLLPPGDPYLQKVNRPLLAPGPALRKRLFRPVASPGVVLAAGRLAGLWTAKAKNRRVEVSVERLGPLPAGELEAEATRVADLRGGALVLTVAG